MKVFDLFSGIGGFSLGLQKAGMETVAFCEIEQPALQVLSKNFSGVPIFGDVQNLTNQELIDNGITIDLICGGFPCQDISVGGKRAGIEKGERSGLWREYARLIDEIKPKYALIENVSGLLSAGLNVVLKDLAEIGYDATWTTLDSQFVGVPQRRRRVYILAVRDGVPAGADIFRFSERDSAELKSEMANIQKSRPWDIPAGRDGQGPFAYYTRQRSDEFACAGVSGAILKRDYKDFTDLVVDEDGPRRVTPEERLLLQGFPRDYVDGCDLSDTDKFIFNGMTVLAVEWIGKCVMEFDRKVSTGELS